MNTIATSAPAQETSSANSPEVELLIGALWSAVLRARLDENQLETIGLALRDGWVTPEGAIQWLTDVGLVDQVITDEVRS